MSCLETDRVKVASVLRAVDSYQNALSLEKQETKVIGELSWQL